MWNIREKSDANKRRSDENVIRERLNLNSVK
jgi:uncharacterized protein (DUF1800 family)